MSCQLMLNWVLLPGQCHFPSMVRSGPLDNLSRKTDLGVVGADPSQCPPQVEMGRV